MSITFHMYSCGKVAYRSMATSRWIYRMTSPPATRIITQGNTNRLFTFSTSTARQLCPRQLHLRECHSFVQKGGRGNGAKKEKEYLLIRNIGRRSARWKTGGQLSESAQSYYHVELHTILCLAHSTRGTSISGLSRPSI